MPEIDAVLFDLYDTLVWSNWLSHSRLLAQHLDVPEASVAAAYEYLREERDGGDFADAGEVLAAVMEHCGLEPDPSRIRRLVDLEAGVLEEHVTLYDDSLSVLSRLRADGFRTGIVSNCSPSTRPVVDRLGLEEAAEVVVLSCEVGAAKPDPAVFHAALDPLGVTARRTLFVDDLTEYLDGAADLGMRTVQITRANALGEDVEGGEHPQVTDLEQLLDLLS